MSDTRDEDDLWYCNLNNDEESTKDGEVMCVEMVLMAFTGCHCKKYAVR